MVPVLYTSTNVGRSPVPRSDSLVSKLANHARTLLQQRPHPGHFPQGRARDISRIEDLVLTKDAERKGPPVLLLYGSGDIGKSCLLQRLLGGGLLQGTSPSPFILTLRRRCGPQRKSQNACSTKVIILPSARSIITELDLETILLRQRRFSCSII